jgi:hypothetical protein
VAQSIMDAEYIAAVEAAKEAVWIRNFINDLRISGCHIDSIPLYMDNNAAFKLIRNPEFYSKSKHIEIKNHFVREKVESGEINTERVSIKDNLADILIKPLLRPAHESMVDRLGMRGSRKGHDFR